MQVDKNHIKCDYCGIIVYRIPAQIKNHKHHFHNTECMGKWMSKNRNHKVKVKCDGCEKMIERSSCYIKRHKHHFHNKECYSKWLDKKVEVKCDYCGKTIKIFRRDIKRNKYHFCNNKCRGKWISENRSGRNSPFWKKIEVKCDYCNKIIEKNPYRIERWDHHFCCKECYSKWQSEHQRGKNSNRHGTHLTEEAIEKIKKARAKQKFPMKDSKIELKTFEYLDKKKIVYRKHVHIPGLLIGTPYKYHQFDVVIDSLKIIVEVQGCYWHGCKKCYPNPNKDQLKWILRDNEIRKIVESKGWRMIYLWEHDINNGKMDEIISL